MEINWSAKKKIFEFKLLLLQICNTLGIGENLIAKQFTVWLYVYLASSDLNAMT